MKPKNLPPLSPAADNAYPNLETYFKTFQEVDYTSSFAQTAAWVRQQCSAIEPALPWWLTLGQFFFGSAFRVAYTVLFLVGMVGACNYPVEVNEPVASVLTWQVNSQDKATVATITSLPGLKKEQLLAEEKVVDGAKVLEYTFTLPAVNKDQMQTYLQNLQQLAGVQHLQVLPITHKTSQPLYEVALKNMLKIEIDATDILDAELKKTIAAKFQEQGLTGVDINIIRDANGQRLILTKLPENPGKDYGFDLTLKDGMHHTRIREQVKHRTEDQSKELPDFKSMTDGQIKDFVIRDHADVALKPADIKITRQGGEINIFIDNKAGIKMEMRVK